MFTEIRNAIQPAKQCYRCSVPLNLPAGNYTVFRNNDNMASPFHPLMEGLTRFDEQTVSTTLVIVGNSDISEYILVGALTAFNSLTHLTVRQHGAIIFN